MSSTYSVFRQTKDYNCAAGAVAFFVYLNSGKTLDVDRITEKLRCDPEEGTPHKPIIEYLRYLFRYDNYIVKSVNSPLLTDVKFPLLVNYYDGEDGHYGVIISLFMQGEESMCELFNPATGEIEHIKWDDFQKSWYSPRYGKKWCLFVTKKGS